MNLFPLIDPKRDAVAGHWEVKGHTLISAGDTEYARKDVMLLRFGEQIEILIRFRDMRGGYPIHCHNTVHEDHQMMMLYDVQDVGDDNARP